MLPASFPARRTLIETAETLAIALAGGLTFTLLGLPAGLVSGSVLAVAAAALLGRPVRVPLGWRASVTSSSAFCSARW